LAAAITDTVNMAAGVAPLGRCIGVPGSQKLIQLGRGVVNKIGGGVDGDSGSK
jgi:hypothetical protein